jgi:hypothetical protein
LIREKVALAHVKQQQCIWLELSNAFDCVSQKEKILLNTENKRIIGLDFVGLKKFIDATEKMNPIAKISNNLQETKDHNKFLEFSVISYITREFIPFDNKRFIDTKNLNSTWSSFSISKPTMKAVSSSCGTADISVKKLNVFSEKRLCQFHCRA